VSDTGSAVWVINGCFVWLPLAAPWTEFPTEYDIGGGVTAFIGATIFEIGSVLLMLEAVNENRKSRPCISLLGPCGGVLCVLGMDRLVETRVYGRGPAECG
jgi:hypothetical protein